MDNVTTSSPRLPYSSLLATGIYLSIIGIIACVGNLIVILVIWADRKRINFTKKQHVPLLLNLAVADIGVAIFGYPFTGLSGIAGKWLFTDTVCKMSGFSCFCLSLVSLDTLAAVSVYRYIVLCKPSWKPRLTPRFTLYVILLSWGYAILWASIPLFGPSSYTYEPFGTSCSIGWNSQIKQDKIFIVCVDIFCFLLHLTLFMYCYIQIIRRYRFISEPSNVGPISNQGFSTLKTRRDMRVTWLILVQVGSFIFVWSPYAIVCTWTMMYDLPLWLTTLPTMLAKLSCALNPIIYSLLNRTFRGKAREIMCKCLLGKVHQSAGKYSVAIWNRTYPMSVDIFCVTPRESKCPTAAIPQNRESTELLGFTYVNGTTADTSIRTSITGLPMHPGFSASLDSVLSLNKSEQILQQRIDPAVCNITVSSTSSSPIIYSSGKISVRGNCCQFTVCDFHRDVKRHSNNMCREAWGTLSRSVSFKEVDYTRKRNNSGTSAICV